MTDLYEAVEHGFSIMRLQEDDYVAIKVSEWMEPEDLGNLAAQLKDAWPGLKLAVFTGDVEITRITPK